MFKMMMLLLTGLTFQKPVRKVKVSRSLKYTVIAKMLAKSAKNGSKKSKSSGKKSRKSASSRARKHKTSKKSKKVQPWQKSNLF